MWLSGRENEREREIKREKAKINKRRKVEER